MFNFKSAHYAKIVLSVTFKLVESKWHTTTRTYGQKHAEKKDDLFSSDLF